MNEQAVALQISLGIHTAAAFALLAASAGLGARSKVIVMDLSVFTDAAAPVTGISKASARVVNHPSAPVPRPQPAEPRVQRTVEPRDLVPAAAPKTEAALPAAEIAQPAGSGSSGDAARTRYLKEQFTYVRELIHRGLVYPPVARKMGWTGRVTVSFVVREDGGVREVKVIKSSGFAALDRSALETIKKCAPYPPPPAEAEFIMPITYQLE